METEIEERSQNHIANSNSTSPKVGLLTSLKARRRFVSQFNGDGEPVGRTGTVKLRHKSTPRL